MYGQSSLLLRVRFCSVGPQAADRITHTDQKRLLPFCLPNCSLGALSFILSLRDSEKGFAQPTGRGGQCLTPIDQKRLTPFVCSFFVGASPCLSRYEKVCRNRTK